MNARFLFLSLAILIAVALAAGCTQYGTQAPVATTAPTPVPTQPPTPAASPSAIPPATTPTYTFTPQPYVTQETVTTVHIRNFSFVPATLTVLPGTQVTWINDDNTAHTVVATGTAAGMFQSRALMKGDTFPYTFASVGNYPYICSIHPDEKGTIVVKAGPEGVTGDVSN